MLRTLRRRPSPAMVVAMLALFVALGTTSVAAIKLQKNAVKTKNIGKGAVKTSKIGGEAVTTPKIDDNAVTTPKIDSGALTASKLGALTRRSGGSAVAPGALGSATAQCLPGEVAISGGPSLPVAVGPGAPPFPPVTPGWRLAASYMDAGATQWTVTVENQSAAIGAFAAVVLCLESG